MPQIEIKASHFKQLKDVMQKYSAALGFIVSLGNQFEDSSHDDIDKEIAPKLKEILGENISPRVRSCCAILMWFVLKVINIQQHGVCKHVTISYLCSWLDGAQQRHWKKT